MRRVLSMFTVLILLAIPAVATELNGTLTTGSFTSNTETKPGDIFEIESRAFGKPLRNSLGARTGSEQLVTVHTL